VLPAYRQTGLSADRQVRRGEFFFFLLAKAQSRKGIVVHSYPQMGQLPLDKGVGGIYSRKDPPRRAGRKAASAEPDFFILAKAQSRKEIVVRSV
jgi:hypothetical protein